MTSADGVGKGGRPANDLLRRLSPQDFALISPYLDQFDASADRVLYNPGDQVESVHFPCGASAAAFVVAIDDDREFDAAVIGREGAAGGIVSHGSLPAFSRITVRFPGPFARLPVARLEAAKGRSRALAGLFARYADCLLAKILQSTACNAVHSIEQRAAKWIIAAAERTQREPVPLTHEQLGMLLGVGRSYASRVIQKFKVARLVETRRKAFLVKDVEGLQAKACLCDPVSKRHFEEVMDGLYREED
jgi:Crp-like helix-turn-helix domain